VSLGLFLGFEFLRVWARFGSYSSIGELKLKVRVVRALKIEPTAVTRTSSLGSRWEFLSS